MFNGYHETPLISYNEFDQEREKKQENVSKWSYGHDVGVQSVQAHQNQLQPPEFRPGKPNFLGIANMVKCNCSGCYPSSENQSYQGDSTRHRPWLPRVFSVPINGSAESCKLPGYHQWENVALTNQGVGFPEGSGGGGFGGTVPHAQYLLDSAENEGYYRHYQNRTELNHPGIIASVKSVEFARKQKDEMMVNSPVQNVLFSRQNGSITCNSSYNLAKRIGSNYCEPNDKYSNVASYSVNPHISRLPVVEPYMKAVPSINQNRVPSTGQGRSISENMSQSCISPGYDRKLCLETGGDKKPRGGYPPVMPKDGMETFQAGHQPPIDLKKFNYPLLNVTREHGNLEMEARRQHNYMSRNNLSEVIKRDNHTPALDNRKDCAVSVSGQINQTNVADIHSGRSHQIPKYFDPKSSCEMFCSERKLENPTYFSHTEDLKNENVAVRLPRSPFVFNDLRFPVSGQNPLSYQNIPATYKNYTRPELPYQGCSLQNRHEYPQVSQNQYAAANAASQEQPSCGINQFMQGSNAFVCDPCQQPGNDKTFPQQFYDEKNSSAALVQMVSPCHSEERQELGTTNYLETIQSGDLTKNGGNKISPLRLLRKKKFVTQRNDPVIEPTPKTPDSAPALDVRKFLSTWAEEEEECVQATQMVVLDCQNIDPEQAKLLNLYENDPLRGVHLDNGSILTVRESNCAKESINQSGDIPVEESSENGPKNDFDPLVDHQKEESQQERVPTSEPETVDNVKEEPPSLESTTKTLPAPKSCKRGRSQEGSRRKRKSEEMSPLDKWTEKKFDFLKRAEETKAAEILRHEEEKKKILERRLSLQQGMASRLAALEKVEEAKQNSFTEKLIDRLSPLVENSQSNSPDGSGGASDLPTSEYRRNKFLDYSEGNMLVNGSFCEDEKENGKSETKGNTFQPPENKEDVKLAGTIALEGTKIKEEILFQSIEMDDIMKKMSEINVRSPNIRTHETNHHSEKVTTISHSTRTKKKEKPEQENEEKLSVGNTSLSQPTIKFSIQKSHDLKISLKVLNNSKKFGNSDEGLGREDTESLGKSIEDSENSTELITPKYKSIQREAPNCDGGLKKSKRRARRKKIEETSDLKASILKVKRNRCLPEKEDRDPLEFEGVSLNGSKMTCSPYSISDDFQVQETVDSAKIKLTFKRHKGNFEADYKINNGTEKLVKDEEDEEKDECLDGDEDWSTTLRERAKENLLAAEAGESLEAKHPVMTISERRRDEDGKNISKHLKSESCEDFQDLSGSPQVPCGDPEDGVPTSPMFSSATQLPPSLEIPARENVSLYETCEKSDNLITTIRTEEDLNKNGEKQVEVIEGNANTCDEATCSKIKSDEFPRYSTAGTASSNVIEKKDSCEDFEKQEIDEISADLIRSAIFPEIEKNDSAEKTENLETAIEMQEENFWDGKTNCSTNDFNHSDGVDSSYQLTPQKGNDENTVHNFLLGNVKSTRKNGPDGKDYAHEQDTGNLGDNPLLDFVDADKCLTQDNENISEEIFTRALCQQEGDDLRSPGVAVKITPDSFALTVSSETSIITGGRLEAKIRDDIQTNSIPGTELEEGEIVDENENEENIYQKTTPAPRHQEFKINKIHRRHSLCSVSFGNVPDIESQLLVKSFSKARSCPPVMNLSIETGVPAPNLNIPVVDIPLPPGDPPPENCFDFIKYFQSLSSSNSVPARNEFIGETAVVDGHETGNEQQLSDSSSCQKRPAPLTPTAGSSAVDILKRSSKIRFSIQRRSKLYSVCSKLGGSSESDSLKKTSEEKSETEKEELIKNRNSVEETKANSGIIEANSFGIEQHKSPEPLEQGKLTCEDVKVGKSQKLEMIDVMSFDGCNFIGDELYKCEDIPTSEDLANGLEVEKVPDDDKFRNMMQNCLDNAKKFLNVGNLKMFSCSVDDLLELDCQLEEHDQEKSANHISRDVLLTSCEESGSDDLGLSSKFQPGDMSMDFLPSFCSEVCPEILPVDNWPYLEEEVPASPTKTKQDENDLIPENGVGSNTFDSKEIMLSYQNKSYTKVREPNKVRRMFLPGVERGSFTRFRRRSLLADGECVRMCSKIRVPRRKTIESLDGDIFSYRNDCDYESEITRLKKGIDKMETFWINKNSLKCRLSLERITKSEEKHRFRSDDLERSPKGSRMSGEVFLNKTACKRKYSLDYKSSVWQPRVVLFRISKKDLKKMYRHPKTRRHSDSSDVDSLKISAAEDYSKDKEAPKRQRYDEMFPNKITEYVMAEAEDKQAAATTPKEKNERFHSSQLHSTKAPLRTLRTSDVWKRKKSRFRNLHTKKKTSNSDISSSVQVLLPTEPMGADAEKVLSELFKESDQSVESNVSNSQVKSTKENNFKDIDEKSRKKSEGDKETRSRGRSRENSPKHRSNNKTEKRHDHRNHRRGGRENLENKHGRDYKVRNEESAHNRHGRSKHTDGKSPQRKKDSEREESPRKMGKLSHATRGKEKSKARETSPESIWVCQVCGFSGAEERISHIKTHPFHCQSCHLAFKTEAYFVDHLMNKHKDIRNQHHCLLCELSFDTEKEYQRHLETREHKHLESVEKNTINTLFTLLTGRPCPVLGVVEMKPEWLPSQAGTVHFYHQATPLSLALQYLKMHHNRSSSSTTSVQ